MARALTRRRTTAAAADTDYTPDNTGSLDPEETQEEAPRARRRSAPARRGNLHTEPDTGDDGSDDEAPRGRRSRPSKDAEDKPQASGGWGSFEKQKSEGGDFPEGLKITDEAILIKVLDEEPFVVYRQHWIERQGKKSFTCLAIKKGDPCPLCDDIGDRPRLQVCFNVVDFTDPDNPEVKVWTVGTRVATQLKNFAKDKKTSPISRADLYWSVSKSGKGNKTVYSINPVKERDLEEDWEIQALDDDEIGAYEDQKYTADIVQYQTRKQLRDVADEALDDD